MSLASIALSRTSLCLAVVCKEADAPLSFRCDVLQELQEGKIDVIVGVNLLREGLDLPQVGVSALITIRLVDSLCVDFCITKSELAICSQVLLFFNVSLVSFVTAFCSQHLRLYTSHSL